MIARLRPFLANTNTLNRLAAALLVVVVIFLVGRLLLFHYHLIVYPYQAEYREGADLLLTSAFARGIDPYALVAQPQYANAYGFVSNLLAAPFVALWGPSFAPGRAVTALADLLSCLLLIAVMRRLGVPRMMCVVAVILFDVGLIADGSSIVARPDGLGLLLFLASLCLPWLDNYSPRSLAVSLALAVLAFYTKIYFLLGALYLGPFLFLCVSKRKAIFYGAVLVALLAVTALIVDQRADFYFANAVFGHLQYEDRFDWAISQFTRVVTFYALLWAALLIGGGLTLLLRRPDWPRLRQLPAQARKHFTLNLSRFSRPLIEGTNTPLALFLLAILLSTLILYLKLGRHRGANMTYYYQLLSPFALIVTFTLLARMRRIHVPVLLALIPTVWLTGQRQVARLANGPDDSSAWIHLMQVVSTRHNVLNSPAMTAIVFQDQLPVYDSGSSEYFQDSYDAQHDVPTLFAAYQSMLRAGIQQHSFDLIATAQLVTPLFRLEDVAEHYQQLETMDLPMPYSFQVWHLILWVPKDD